MAGYLVPMTTALATTTATQLTRFGYAAQVYMRGSQPIIWLTNAARNSTAMTILGRVLQTLKTAGSWIGVATIVDTLLPGDIPFVPSLGGDGGGGILPGTGGSGPHPASVVKTWNANGVNFVRLADGRLGAQNKLGTWKYWRPKKPIVLYASGASDLNTLLKADKAAERQLKKLKKAVDRRFPDRRRRETPKPAPPPQVAGTPAIIIEGGPGHVVQKS